MSTNNETVEYRYTADASNLLGELTKVRSSMEATRSAGQAAGRGVADGLSSAKAAGDKFIDGLRQQAATAAKTREAIGRSAKMTAGEMAQLNYQLTDVVTSLQSGQSPFTVLLQQGGQIKDTLGGIGPALSKIAGLFTPIRLAAAGAAGAVVGLGVALLSGYRENAEFNKSLLMTGNYAGLTTERMKSLSRAIEEKTRLTIADAREAVQATAATGRFTQSVVGPASTAVALVADRTGKRVSEVAQDFARVADSATKFGVEQNRSMNFLTFSQYQYIKALEASGEKEHAQIEVMRLIADAAGRKLPNELGVLERSWNTLGKAASSAWAAMKDIGRPDTLTEQLAKQQARLEAARAAIERPKSTASREAREARAAALQADIAATNRALLNEENARIDAATRAAAEKKKIEEAEAGHGSRLLDLERARLQLSSAQREAAYAQELAGLQRHQTELMLAGKPMGDDEMAQRRAAIERRQIQERINLLDQEAGIERKRSASSPDEKIAQEVKLLDIGRQRLALKTQLANVDDGEQAFAAAVARAAEDARRENAQRQMDRVSSAQRTAAELKETNERLNIDLMRDDKQRAVALIALEEQQMRDRLALHLLTADEVKAIEDDLAKWRAARMEQVNRSMQGQFGKLMDDWSNTQKRMRDETDATMMNLVRTGEDAFAEFARTGKVSADSLFRYISEQLFRSLYRDMISYFQGPLRAAAGSGGGIGGIIGSLFGGGGGYSGGLPSGLIPSGFMMAKGAAVDRSGIAKFAMGDAFTNNVFSSPRLFRFGKGGANLGMLGEAGPEGVLPLKRGPGGKLGVSVYGGSPAGAQPATVIQHNTYNVAAGVSPAVLAAALERNNQMLKSESEQGFMRGRDAVRALEAY